MPTRFITRVFLALCVCLFVGYIALLATQNGLGEWYTSLEKPAFHPPESIFGPIWALMYVLMGIAAGIVWSKGFYHKWVQTALYHFGFQLLLNAGWSLLFFGLHEPFWALLDITALFIVLLLSIKWFKIVSDTAAYLLIPYAVWVLFAAAINFEIWRLN